MRLIAVLGLTLGMLAGTSYADHEGSDHAGLKRIPIPGSDFPISLAVRVPANAETIYLSGTVPQVINEDAEPGSRAAYGDMTDQTVSTLNAIKAKLESMGLGIGDIIMMRAYLVGDPEQGGKLDFAGFMKGYVQFFGTEEQPNLPSRSAFQIAGLARPAWLIEIEVVAAKAAQ